MIWRLGAFRLMGQYSIPKSASQGFDTGSLETTAGVERQNSCQEHVANDSMKCINLKHNNAKIRDLTSSQMP